jgi:hypothetical protein
VLATRAARTGAIDYSTTTRDDVFSIMREGLILRDVKREMMAQTLSTFDLVYASPQNRSFQKAFIKNGLPWMASEHSEENMVQSMADLWREFEEELKAQEEHGERPDQTGLSE